MGLVRTIVALGRSRAQLEDTRLLVDTGSFYSAIDPQLRQRLGLIPGMPAQTQLAEGRIIDTELTVAYIRIDGREAGIPVEVADVPEPLLGVTALEALGLKVNPVSNALEEDSPRQRPPTTIYFLRLRDA